MKPAILIITSLIMLGGSCRKNNSANQLPPETTTGAMTFGCKVNGEIFVSKDGRGKPGLFAQYVNLGPGTGGGWHLNIPAINLKPSDWIGVSIATDSLLVKEGFRYPFGSGKGCAHARYYAGLNNYPKNSNDSGSLFITKHDMAQKILSGTFAFSGTNGNGEEVNVTEGRFDIKY